MKKKMREDGEVHSEIKSSLLANLPLSSIIYVVPYIPGIEGVNSAKKKPEKKHQRLGQVPLEINDYIKLIFSRYSIYLIIYMCLR